MIRISLLYIFFFTLLTTEVKGDCFVKKDLRTDWLIYEDNAYGPFLSRSSLQVNTIYVHLNEHLFKGDRLLIESPNPFSFFLNGELLFDQRTRLSISIDSLATTGNHKSITLLINSKDIDYQSLTTFVISDVPRYSSSNQGPLVRSDNGFKNFIVTSVLCLLILFALLLKLNSKQMSYYFSFYKLFSLRESDDSQAFNKIASSANVLFYFFLSLLIGFVLILLLANLSPPSFLSANLQPRDFFDGILLWLKVSAFIFLLILGKAVVVIIFSMLFEIKDQAGYQFLNFIRVLAISMMMLATLATFYFILWGDGGLFLLGLYKLGIWIMAGWIILAFFKLMRQVHFSMFQLFSYLCATEIIPFLFLFKILYE